MRREPTTSPGADTTFTESYGYGVGAVGFALFGLGILAQAPALVLCASVGFVFAAYKAVDDAPDETVPLRIDRAVTDDIVRQGSEIDVRVAVTNIGDSHLLDVRVVDGVPDSLEVLDGSTRGGAALRPGDRVVFEYTVRAAHGEHTWDPATVIVANASGSAERKAAVESESETTLRCAPIPTATVDLSARSLTSHFEGRIATDSGGSGIEFYGIREYRKGDPIRRLDWKHFASTGELGTIDFREERGVSVVLLLDARPAAYLASRHDGVHAVERGVAAAGQVLNDLLASGNRFGIAVYGREDAWLPLGTGNGHRSRAINLLTEHSSLSVVPPERDLYASFLEERREELLWQRVDRLHRRLPSDTQLFCFSPCCDGFFPSVVRRLDAYGHPVTLLSPDPTSTETPGRYLASLARQARLRLLVQDGIRVVDWADDEPLETAIARAQSGWSR